MDWILKKANDDTERYHLNKILDDIRVTIDNIVPSAGVTSVGATVPTGFTITGSPITGAGTLAITYAAGYQGYTSAEATKLAGIATGATANTGTVTSVGLAAPTGLTVSGSPVTTTGTLTLTYTSGYSIPTTTKQSQWDTAYTTRNRWDGGATSLVASTGRTSLGLGTSATVNTGTSGATIPLLNGNNTWSGTASYTTWMNVASSIRSTNNNGGTGYSGSGVEIYYRQDVQRGHLISYNRTTALWQRLDIIGNPIILFHDGTQVMTTASTGITVTGTVQDSSANVRNLPPTLRNSNTAFTSADVGKIIYKNNTTGYTWTLYSGTAGDAITIKNFGSSSNITIARGGFALWDDAGNNADFTLLPNKSRTLVCESSGVWWVL